MKELKKILSAVKKGWRYLLAVLFTLTIFFVSISAVDRLMRTEIKTRNNATMEYSKSMLEDSLLNIERSSSIFLKNASSVAISRSNGDVFQDLNLDKAPYRLSVDILNYCASNPLSKDVLIWFPGIDRIVGKYGIFSTYQYYKILYPSSGSRQEQFSAWKRRVLEGVGARLMPYKNMPDENAQFFYIRSSPLIYADQPERVLITQLNTDALNSIIGQMARSNSIVSYRFMSAGNESAENEPETVFLWQQTKGNDVYSGERMQQAVFSETWNLFFQMNMVAGRAYNSLQTLRRVILYILLLFTAAILGILVMHLIRSNRMLKLNTQLEELLKTLSRKGKTETKNRQTDEQIQAASALPPARKDISSAVEEILEREYTDPLIGLAGVAERLGINQSFLSRKFSEEHDCSFTTWLNRIRIRHAKELIRENPGSSNGDIASVTGFSSDTNFLRVFKRMEGMTPGEYRKQLKGEKDI